MYTYEKTKLKAVDTITHGAMALMLSKDHEEARKLANSIMEACRMVLWLEDLQESFEKGDLEGMRAARAKYDR